MQFDINNKSCVKSINDIGETVYKDICSGAEAVIPWGSVDWIAFVGVSIILTLAVSILFMLFYSTYREFLLDR